MIYRLIDEFNHQIFEFRKDNEEYFTGTLWEVGLWDMDGTPDEYQFVASVYIKWDLCSHWLFYGEGYDFDTHDSHDSYYHICGGSNYVSFMQGMAFVCEVAKMNIENYDSEEFEMVSKLNLLKDCKIIKIEK